MVSRHFSPALMNYKMKKKKRGKKKKKKRKNYMCKSERPQVESVKRQGQPGQLPR